MPLLIPQFLLEIAFSNNLQYAKLQNCLPIRFNHSGPSRDTKISKFLPLFFMIQLFNNSDPVMGNVFLSDEMVIQTL